jgi:predicted RNA binding protein YcfA (HicA-like mRNA interferase family)
MIYMPPKIRKLKADLSKAGFYFRPGKGSHMVWYHDADPTLQITLAGRDDDDADSYQIKEVRNALKRIERM